MLSISQRDNKGILWKMNNIRRDLKRKPLYQGEMEMKLIIKIREDPTFLSIRFIQPY